MNCFFVIHVILILVLAGFIQYCFSTNVPDNSTAIFWHISDFHLDLNYSVEGDPGNMCHKDSNKTFHNGPFGNFLCDAPQDLIKLTVRNMKKIEANPNFIIWTGDNLAHTQNPSPSWKDIFEGVKYVSQVLRENFNSTLIFPCIGNHDEFPPNIINPNNGSIYEEFLEKGAWNIILPNATWSTFKKGGFYSYNIFEKLKIISLNTILWYATNPLVKDLIDPVDQFKWFKEELEKAVSSSTKVYIIGHVAPGFYNRVKPGEMSTPTVHPQYLKKYLSLIRDYSNIIVGQMFGHVHNDLFELQYCDTGSVKNSVLLTSSVSPWHSVRGEGNLTLAVNPSVRLILYDNVSYILKDYKHYFLNLTYANEYPNEKDGETLYKLLYTFTTTYGVSNLTSQSLTKVYENLKANSDLYALFFKYLTSAKETINCDNNCRIAQLCSMSCTSETEYYSCMHKGNGDSSKPDDNSNTIILSLAIIFVCFVIIFLALYMKRRKGHKNREDYLLT